MKIYQCMTSHFSLTRYLPPSFPHTTMLHSNPSANDQDFYFDHSLRDLFFFSFFFVLLAVYCSVGLICILCIYVCRKTAL